MQALPQRTDTKLYRIQTPQTPIARTQAYDRFHMDEFPNGTNMIVAVLAYTGVALLPDESSVISPRLSVQPNVKDEHQTCSFLISSFSVTHVFLIVA